MAIRIVRLGTPRLPQEGTRIGTVRRLPRGVRKERYAAEDWFDVWYPDLAPSANLVKRAQAAESDRDWDKFVKSFRAEMRAPSPSRTLDLLAALSHHAQLSVGCYCENAARCHRSVLRALLVERGVTERRLVTIRPILRYPDPRLRLAAEPVTLFDDALRHLATDLLETMLAAEGIGITAPHIGVAQRVAVIQISPEDGARVYVNPAIAWASSDLIRHQEGSVSMQGVVEEVERSAQIRVRYQDLHGIEQTEEASGLLAICHQHEIDQLDGIFWVQRLSRLKRERVLKRYERLLRGA